MAIAESPAVGPHSMEVYDVLVPVFLGGAIDQMAALDDRTIDPGWLAQVVELVEFAENVALADGARIAAEPAAVAAALSSTYTDPELLENLDQVPARALVLMMKHLSRMASWAQATQTTLMAAFSRPGVAVPFDDVMDAVVAALSSSGTELDETAAARAASTRAVVGDDAWDLTVADQAGRIAAAEIGPALNLTPITARNRVVEAQTFADDLPVTHERWRQGHLDRVRAGIVAERTAVLDRAGKADVEHRLLGVGAARDAGRLTPGRLRSAVDRAVIQADPDAARRRTERAHQERSVHITPRDDDMARFAADVRSPVALLAREVLDAAARKLPAECRGDRTLPQLRADVFGDIFTSLATHGQVDIRCPAGVRPGADQAATDAASLDDPLPLVDTEHEGHRTGAPASEWAPLGSSIAVTVAASTLAGFDDNPALLAGYGCITADLARSLAVSARRAAIIVERPSAAPPAPSPRAPGARAPDARRDSPPGPVSPPVPARSKPGTSPGGQRPRSPEQHATWCSPELDFGREVYRPPAALRELVLQRDRTCRFPGCAQPSRRCDLDHRVPFQHNASSDDGAPAGRTDAVDGRTDAAAGRTDTAAGRTGDVDGGTTCPCNLDLLCRFHHRVKTFTGWSAVRLPGNTVTWTSPLGFRHIDQVEPLPRDRWTAGHPAPLPVDRPDPDRADPPPF